MVGDPFRYCDDETRSRILKENAVLINVCVCAVPVVMLIVAVVLAVTHPC